MLTLRAALALIQSTVLLIALSGCKQSRADRHHRPILTETGPTPTAAATALDQGDLEGVSLLGAPLRRPALPPDVLAKRERELEEARHEYDRALHDEDAIIWLGRRLAYLGRYREAIDAFSNGLAIHPESYQLLRHRGHRLITLRRFDDALADLERAAALIEGVPDEVEPDGQPNAQNIPTSTSHTNIFYHLALAHYLRGEFDKAAEAWRQCRALAQNNDMRVAASYWLFLSLKRLGRQEDANAILDSVTPEMNIIENMSYHRLMLAFKGALDPAALQAGGDDPSIDMATIGYGLAMRELLHGDKDAAMSAFRRARAESNWAAFGHIAAEAELAREQR